MLPTEPYQILNSAGEIVGDIPADLSNERLVAFYRWMVLGRLFSDRMVALQRQGRLGTLAPLHGQEASLVGLAAPLQPEDWLGGSYREVLAYMVKGYPMASVLSYYAGRLDHQAPFEARCLQIQIVLATQMLHMVGIAMGIQYEGKPHVAVGVCGDGASSEGDFNEALNFAAVYKAPAILVVQNNGWAISVPRHKQTAAQYIAHRGPGFGLPSYLVDGNDLLAVYQVMRDCVARARAGDGPSLIELITYRMGAHTTADDPTKYRPAEELAYWEARDPISRYQQFLRQQGLLSEAADKAMYDEVRAEIQAVVTEFEAWSPQDPTQIYELVYETMTPQLQQQKAEFRQASVETLRASVR